MENKKKIGIGLITCNREDFCKKTLNDILNCQDVLDHIVIVNDGKKITFDDNVINNEKIHIIQHETNLGVGLTKNDALKYLYERGCEYLFLIEDDIGINNKEIFKKYIDIHNFTKVHHINFGYHGDANKVYQNGKMVPRPLYRIEIKSKEDKNTTLLSVVFNRHCVGAFSFYTRKCITMVGFMDERFHNSMEHIDHTYRIIKNKLHPAFWWFIDLEDSYNYLYEHGDVKTDSIIRKMENWNNMVNTGESTFQKKWGIHPQRIPVTQPNEMLNFFRENNV